MPKYEAIHSNIPLLFRPDPGDTTVLTAFLESVGALLDDLASDMGMVMQSHWSGYADDARFSRHLSLCRGIEGLAPLQLTTTADRLTWETFAHVQDLARIGALLALSPHRDPKALQESVEAYRTRLLRYMRLYRHGLGTVDAIRAVVEMELPADLTVPTPQRERSFSIEEFIPLRSTRHAFESRRAAADALADEVGPLMRWSFSNDGLSAVPVTLYLQGITPVAGQKDPTRNPTVECYRSAQNRPPLAVAYQGVLGPDETLCLRPAYVSWLGGAAGLLNARSAPDKATPADPTAPGPWADVPGAPAAVVTTLLQTSDRVLWAAVVQGTENQLWRHDGSTWQRAIETTSLATVHCLGEIGRQLWVGTVAGVLCIDLFPPEGETFTATPQADLAGRSVYCLCGDRQARWWIGTDNGLYQRQPDERLSPVAALAGTAIRAIHEARDGVLYFGGDLGLFQYQPGADRWAWYHGEAESDQVSDWKGFQPGALPLPEAAWLPPVHAVHVSADASLWIGTQQGIARYYARRENGVTYKTLLAAYPDLGVGPVHQIREDAHGLTWFVTQQGLFRYDGRDLAQYQAAPGRWVSMGRADTLYDDITPAERDAWRYLRSGTPAWQRFDRYLNQWRTYNGPVRSNAEAVLHCLEWTDSLHAERGTLGTDGTFTPHTSGHPSLDRFMMRLKPSEDRIVTGGLPAVPRMPKGNSTWRYLALEEPGMPISPNRPWWSREGRLFDDTPKAAPYPARHTVPFPTASSNWFGEVVFAYPPAARLWLEWAPRRRLTTLVRLSKRTDEETIAPAILDRVWQGIQRVRPAGLRVMLAVARDIVRGGEL